MTNINHDEAPVSAGDLTCLVTGATSGIGEAIATRLAAQGATVIAVARNTERGHDAAQRIRQRVPDARIDVLTADLSIPLQVRALANEVTARYDRLDALILNAAVARPRRELTCDGFEVDFATNHLSPFLLTQLLGGLLSASAPSRIVTVSSSGHRQVKRVNLEALPTGDNFHHMRTYSTTKLLNILFTTELAHRLADTAVTANTADPGFVRTALGRDAEGAFRLFLKAARPFQLSPDQAAATPVHLATSPEVVDVTGGYFVKCRLSNPSDLARDRALAEQLWDLTEHLVAANGQ
jgi:NAD(P)-dependent dehydrogenase (short-subunit alcohol dehydrogenase family)